MNTPEDFASLSWEELLALVAEQQQQTQGLGDPAHHHHGMGLNW
jgi:hypothetical protein